MASFSRSQEHKTLGQDKSDVKQQHVQESEPLLKKESFSLEDSAIISRRSEISTWRVVLNLVNSMEGIGFLALPYAIHEGRLAVLIGLIVIPFVLGYSAYLLADCLDDEDEFGNRKRVRSTYHDIGLACWPPFRQILFIFISISLYTTSCSFIVLCGTLMSQQFPEVPISQSQWACIGTALVFPTVFFRTFSHLAWLSLIGVAALISSAAIALSYEFKEISNWDFRSLLFWDTRGVFASLSIVTLSYGIHLASVPMSAEVSQPSRFKVALIWTYFLGATYKIVFAAAGFLSYTVNTKEVILNNLPSGLPVKIIATFFIVNVLMSYPIVVRILIKNIEELALYRRIMESVSPVVCFVLLRIFVTLAILEFAVVIPHFALVTAFAGSFAYCIVLVFPGLFHVILKYKRLSKLQVVCDVVLIILGVIGFFFGLITTILLVS